MSETTASTTVPQPMPPFKVLQLPIVAQLNYLLSKNCKLVGVARLVERLLPIPEILGSNPAVEKFIHYHLH